MFNYKYLVSYLLTNSVGACYQHSTVHTLFRCCHDGYFVNNQQNMAPVSAGFF